MDENFKLILDLVEELNCYTRIYPAFRIRPVGAPCSAARTNQDNAIALEDSARDVLRRAEVIIRKLEIAENAKGSDDKPIKRLRLK